MVRVAAVILGLIVAALAPIAAWAEGRVSREADMAEYMREILRATQDPRLVADRLGLREARFLGAEQTSVTFVYDGNAVSPARSVTHTVGPDFVPESTVHRAPDPLAPHAGEKADFTMTLWLYEWRNGDGSYSQQAAISGYWSSTEYSWIDDPADVIDVRWTVGDLVYTSSTPFDGVKRDQHTNGIASFTVGDQVKSWDLFVNFRPVSHGVHGKWTNVFANYHQA